MSEKEETDSEKDASESSEEEGLCGGGLVVDGVGCRRVGLLEGGGGTERGGAKVTGDD